MAVCQTDLSNVDYRFLDISLQDRSFNHLSVGLLSITRESSHREIINSFQSYKFSLFRVLGGYGKGIRAGSDRFGGGSVRSSSDLSIQAALSELCARRDDRRGGKGISKEGRGPSRIFGRSSIVATLPRKTDSEMPAPGRPRPIFHLHIRHLPL